MCDGDSNDLATKVSDIVQEESWHTGLANDVVPAIDGGGPNNLGPNNENQCDVIHKSVDAGEKVVAKFGAVWETEQERQDD